MSCSTPGAGPVAACWPGAAGAGWAVASGDVAAAGLAGSCRAGFAGFGDVGALYAGGDAGCCASAAPNDPEAESIIAASAVTVALSSFTTKPRATSPLPN